MGQTPSLEPSQIKQIAVWATAGVAIKVIAERIPCTPSQAYHYWRTSSLYNKPPSIRRRKMFWKAREHQRVTQRVEARAMQERQRDAIALADAKLWLASEIEAAKIEMKTSPAYKPTMAAMGVGA